jgi:hypothetical protein
MVLEHLPIAAKTLKFNLQVTVTSTSGGQGKLCYVHTLQND